MLVIVLFALVPLVAFVILAIADGCAPHAIRPRRWDIAINLVSFAMQGAVVPSVGYAISAVVLPQVFPTGNALLGLGFVGAFLLNFVGVDLLYYWQHRLFHLPVLWPWHRCHHASPWLDVWATARNSLATNFLFVYLLMNPVLAYISGSLEGFFAGALATASLDLLRHSRLSLEWPRWLGRVLVTPRLHHRHHDAYAAPANFGANLIVWDRMFGTARLADGWPRSYAALDVPSPLAQLLYPVRIRARKRSNHAPDSGAAAN